MRASDIPVKIQTPFALNAGSSFAATIPQSTLTPGVASWTVGFPPTTFTPVASGGLPPRGQDMNGVLLAMSAWLQWLNAGGGIEVYDATFSTAIGGYPAGAVLQSTTGNYLWISTAENNTTDPDAPGTGWQQLTIKITPYAGNPNGNVAGVSGGANGLSPSFIWDSVHNQLFVCTVTGNAASAVWTSVSASGSVTWAGSAGGTGNVITLTPAVPLLAYSTEAFDFLVTNANTGATTVNVSGLGARPVVKDLISGPTPLTGSELIAGNVARIRNDGTGVYHLTAVPPVVGGFVVITASQTLQPGDYFVDTSGGAITIMLSGALGGAYTFLDAKNTWGTNNLTIDGNSHAIGPTATNTAGTFVANVSDYQFYVEAAQTYWRLA